jgi:hypothetical protein
MKGNAVKSHSPRKNTKTHRKNSKEKTTKQEPKTINTFRKIT